MDSTRNHDKLVEEIASRMLTIFLENQSLVQHRNAVLKENILTDSVFLRDLKEALEKTN